MRCQACKVEYDTLETATIYRGNIQPQCKCDYGGNTRLLLCRACMDMFDKKIDDVRNFVRERKSGK